MQGPFDPEERRVSVRRFLPPHPGGQELIAKLMRYFLGKPTEFTVDLPPDIGTDFQRTVWASLNKIPYGEYETYGELALRLGLPIGRARHVGNAAAQNPQGLVPRHCMENATA